MANKIDDLAVEMASAKEKLKDINSTINRDRAVMAELEKSIKDKKAEVAEVEKELAAKKDEIASLDILKKDTEKEFGEIRDNLKGEIKKLSENKKRDEEKYQISIEELSNDIRVLTGRKTALNNEIADLEKAKREAVIAKEQGVAEKEVEIKKVEEKLNNFTLLFDKQNAEYNKVT
jgi:chromosome segregation protein